MLKGTTTDKTGETQGDISTETGAKVSKAGRPKKDPAQKTAKVNGDEEPKKRKNKKQKEGENNALEIEEIPALEATIGKPKKDEKVINTGNGDILNIPALVEDGGKGTKLPNVDTNSLLNAYMLGGNPGLGMGIPGFPGMGGIPGMPGMPMLSENDLAMYNKAIQELMKSGGMGPFLGGQNTKDMLGFLPGNKK